MVSKIDAVGGYGNSAGCQVALVVVVVVLMIRKVSCRPAVSRTMQFDNSSSVGDATNTLLLPQSNPSRCFCDRTNLLNIYSL